MTTDELYHAVMHYEDTGQLPEGDEGLIIRFIADWFVYMTLYDPQQRWRRA